MTPINLLDFAEHSQKIPTVLLREKNYHPTVSKWRIFAAYALDLLSVFYATFLMLELFKLSLHGIFITSHLQKALTTISLNSVTYLLPLTFVGYFFSCYFFNDGQTLGLKKMKIRARMPVMSYQSSFEWSVYSALFYVSYGMIALFGVKNWFQSRQLGIFGVHDYLYQNLISPKIDYSFDLHAHLDQAPAERDEEFSLAA